MGLLEGESLLLQRMGGALARAGGKDKKHATKQIDRLLSNKGISIWKLAPAWIHYMLKDKEEITVALYWSSFADDKQTMLSLDVLTKKGASTPLLWKSVEYERLKHNRARYEDQLLSHLKESLPATVKVTFIADRVFADKKFFKFIDEELQFDYVIRIKSNTTVSYRDTNQKACDYVRTDGRVNILKDVFIT